MKQKIVGLLIAILLFNTLVPNFIFAADDEIKKDTIQDIDKAYSEGDAYDKLYDEGKADVNGETFEVNKTPSLGSVLAGALTGMVNVVPFAISSMMSFVSGYNVPHEFFTIEDLVFGYIPFFDIDFFKIDQENGNKSNNAIKEAVTNWYYAVRNLAIVISLVILVYVAIRMALSVTAYGKSKYKKMLINWFVSFALIFMMNYFVVAALTVSDGLTSILAPHNNSKSFEQDLMQMNLNKMNQYSGWELIVPALTYWVLIFYQFKFFMMYMKRLLSTGFLVLISPLITVSYAIDKIQDNEAQALSTWFKELMTNIFMQPLHALIYIVFMFSAAKIAQVAPLFAVFFLMALSKTEKVVRNSIGIGEVKSIGTMEDTVPFESRGGAAQQRHSEVEAEKKKEKAEKEKKKAEKESEAAKKAWQDMGEDK